VIYREKLRHKSPVEIQHAIRFAKILSQAATELDKTNAAAVYEKDIEKHSKHSETFMGRKLRNTSAIAS
jgi:hypothetical protein